MHIRICDAYRQFLHMDHDHVRVRGADVVLDHEPPSARVAVVARPGWTNFSFAVRLSPAMKAGTKGRSASARL